LFTQKISWKNFGFILLFVITSTQVILPQNSNTFLQFEKQTLQGLDATFKFDFDESEKIFNRLIEKYPDAPAGYHFKSIPHLWKYLDNKNDSDYVSFINLSDSTIKKAMDLLESDSVDTFLYYILGSTYSYRAVAFTRQEKYLDAVLATKKSFSYLSNTILIDSTFYDAYMGLGLFNFFIAQTPPALKWAMRMTGIEGEKDKGIEFLKLAADKGKFSKVEALFYFSQILAEFYAEYDKAEEILISLNAKYRKNLLFKYSLASFYLKLSRLEKSEIILDRIISSTDTNFSQLIRYSFLSMGNIYFYRNNFDKAGSYYHIFLSDSSEDYYRGIAGLKLGLCYSFVGDSLNAAKYFELTGEGNTDIDDDRYAKIIGERFINTPPDSLQLKIIFIKNLSKAGKYAEARDSLLIMLKEGLSKSQLAEINLYLSDVSFHLDSLTQAYSYAVSAIANDEGEEWIRPFAYYYAARINLKLNNLQDAKTYIENAKEYSDYFYENRLANMLNAVEYELKKLEDAVP
jgi:tetratricopeptide (TPR) repeat protein